ncbi:nucleotidyltransferase [Clostridium carnis]|uniref:Nucleotidyltransferase n=1 Tax=Clostridium carnis TaxID=1530 RepID=A0ABY6SPU7_9CLOT|nr:MULTISPECIES: nucleotidyltransferase domain-containing protein [Clostridium]CAI3634648.1 Nucleotidyltransferase [Clostridium neonatale]VDG69883.1 nucleotidyltransferase [Clostridium carnis]
MCGLTNKDLCYILDGIKKHTEIDKAIIFGSRALGNYKKGSDIHLTISGVEITKDILNDLYDYLNEVCPLPYFFDLLHYESITNDNLKKHIDEYGKLIYKK